MATHMDLILEQLDTLVELLLRESKNLQHWVDEDLSDWRQDDYYTLVYHIDNLTSHFADIRDDLLPGTSATIAGNRLGGGLRDIREFSAVMLDNHDLSATQSDQLHLIHMTSADLADIVREITAL
jgi:hypothetical protein